MSHEDSHWQLGLRPLGPSTLWLKECRVTWRLPLTIWTLPTRPFNFKLKKRPFGERLPLAIWILLIRPSNLVIGGAPSHKKIPTGNLNLADSALRPFEGALSHKKTSSGSLNYTLGPSTFEGVPTRRLLLGPVFFLQNPITGRA